MLEDRSPVAVVGAGLTGASWAGLFAAYGLEVRLTDRDPDALEQGFERARQAGTFLLEEGLADEDEASWGLGLLRAEPDLAAAVAGVTLVQEAVREDLDLKREVFRAVAAAAPPAALLASSSSGLSITEIQEGVPGPERCLAAHPYNPPHLVPLVELAPGRSTTREALLRAESFYRSVGKEPVVLQRDIPGYIGNRLSAALWREAIEIVREGVASVEAVDRAMRTGPGLRWAVMGPHLLYELGGGEAGIRGHLEHLADVKEAILADLATWTVFPEETSAILEAGLAEEKAGPPYAGSGGRADAGRTGGPASREGAQPNPPPQPAGPADIALLRDKALAAVVRALRSTRAL